MRSPSRTASSMSCVTSRIVLRTVFCSARNSFWRRSRTTGSTAPNGSSISSTGGSAARARATPTRWRCPPESCSGYRPPYTAGSSPTSSRSSAARARALALGVPISCGTVAVFSSTVLCGNSPTCWMTYPMSPAQLYRIGVRDVLAAEQDPARGRLDQPVDHLHRGGLAAAGRAHEGDQLALRHLEGQVLDRRRPVGVALGHMLESDHPPILPHTLRVVCDGSITPLRRIPAIVGPGG